MSKQTEEFLRKVRKRFDRCVEAESKNRDAAIEDLRFRYGEQWPEEVLREREAEGRPCLVLNKIPAFIRQVINDIRQSRPSGKVRPVDSQSDPKKAQIISGMIRAIENNSNASVAYDWGAEYAATIGWGYWRIVTEYEHDFSFNQIAKIKRVRNPFSVYLDPDHQEPDGSDAKYGFVVTYLDKEVFEEKYPDAESEWPEEGRGGHKERWFTDGKVRIAEYFEVKSIEQEISLMPDGRIEFGKQKDAIQTRMTQNDQVVYYKLTGQDILEDNIFPSKYIPLIPVLGEELDIEGERKLNGMVKDLKDPMRQYNYWRSSETERVALQPKAPFVGAKGQFKSPKWKSANRKNHAYLEYERVEGEPPPRRESPPEMSTGISQVIALAEGEMKAIAGQYDPSLGEVSPDVSGRAVLARQKRGDVSNYHYVDNLGRSLVHTYRILVDLIPKIYDTPRMVDIIEPDKSEKQIQINQSFIDNNQKEQLFDMTIGRYDVSVDVGPSYTTQRQEAAEAMLEMIQYFPQAAPLIGDLLAKNFDWPNADEIAKRLRMLLPMDVVDEENPQVKAKMAEYEAMIKQLTDYIKALEAVTQQKDQQIQNKEGDYQIKLAEIKRKYEEMHQNFITDMTELELKHDQNVPGSAV